MLGKTVGLFQRKIFTYPLSGTAVISRSLFAGSARKVIRSGCFGCCTDDDDDDDDDNDDDVTNC